MSNGLSRMEAVSAVRSSERRWHHLIENSTDAISVLDADGTVIYTSPVAERLFGHSFDETAGSSMLSKVHPDDFDRAIEAFSAILERSGPSEPVEIRIVRADGSTAWVEAVTNNLLDDPDVAGIVVNTREITDRKVAEEALRQSESRWRLLVEHSSDVISVIDAGGELVSSTRGSLFDVPGAEAVTGASFFEYVHPDDAPRVAEVFATILERSGPSEPVEVRVLDGQGGWRWIEGLANNLLDDPDVAGIVVNTRSIGARKRAEEALRESEERFRFIVQHATDVITVLNADGTVNYASPSAATLPGFPSSGESFVERIRALGEHDNAEALERLAKQLRTPGVHEPIHLSLVAGGATRQVELTVNNRLEDPSTAAVMVVTRDITERETQKRRRIMDELFADLVVGVIDNAHLGHAHAAGLLRASTYSAIVVPLDQEARTGDSELSDAVGRTVEALQPSGSLWGKFGGLGGVVIPGDEHAPALAERLTEALGRILPDDGFIVAAGAPKRGDNALKDALDDALRVLTLARRNGLRGTVTANDVVVPALLTSAPDVAQALSHMLEPLIEEDQRGRGELVHTLRSYLAEGLSVHRTAEALVVHRNTVRSRLKRIESLIGGDVAARKLQLELAMLALDLDAAESGASS